MQPGLAALLLSLAHGTLAFLGEPRCPSQAAVRTQLTELDPRAFESSARQLILLELDPQGLRVRLFDENGHMLEERLLAGAKSCAEWARITAALLATWATDLGAPDLALASLSTSPAVAPVVVAEASADVPASERRGTHWQGEIGVGPLGAWASDGTTALGGEILAGLAPLARPYGGQLIMTATGSRSFPIGPGTAHWQRFALGLGGYGSLGSGAFKLQLGGALLSGLLTSSGEGFLVARSGTAFEVGLNTSARALWAFTRSSSAWLQLGASFWPRADHVQVVSGSDTVYSAQVPPIDLFVTLGLSLTGDL